MAGTPLTFTAAPDAGSTWQGWTGACTGLSTSCTVTAYDQLLVVANFRAAQASSVFYYHLDAIGSVRAVTDASGAVVERHDYRPFGEDNQSLPADGADANRFLGEPRDATGLDYFHARYYSKFRGRFQTVDPGHAAATLFDGQSWNAYAYGRNNPLRFVDANGLGPCVSTGVVFTDPGNGNSIVGTGTEYGCDGSGSGGGNYLGSGSGGGGGADGSGCDGNRAAQSIGRFGLAPTGDPCKGDQGSLPGGPPISTGPTHVPIVVPPITSGPPPGTPSILVDQLNRAVTGLRQRMDTVKSCNDFYGGKGQEQLLLQNFRFYDGSREPDVAAKTFGNVSFINQNGTWLDGHGAGEWNTTSQLATQEVILGHELAHTLFEQTRFLPDANDPGLNRSQTGRLLRDCFGGR